MSGFSSSFSLYSLSLVSKAGTCLCVCTLMSVGAAPGKCLLATISERWCLPILQVACISRQTPSKAVMIFRVVCPFAGAERCCNAISMEAVRGCKRVMALLETDWDCLMTNRFASSEVGLLFQCFARCPSKASFHGKQRFYFGVLPARRFLESDSLSFFSYSSHHSMPPGVTWKSRWPAAGVEWAHGAIQERWGHSEFVLWQVERCFKGTQWLRGSKYWIAKCSQCSSRSDRHWVYYVLQLWQILKLEVTGRIRMSQRFRLCTKSFEISSMPSEGMVRPRQCTFIYIYIYTEHVGIRRNSMKFWCGDVFFFSFLLSVWDFEHVRQTLPRGEAMDSVDQRAKTARCFLEELNAKARRLSESEAARAQSQVIPSI